MSKHKNNNTTYSAEEEQYPVDETVIEETTVEETSVTTPEIETDEPVVVEETPKFVIGVVVGCGKLNVRKQMSTTADILCELPVKSEVQVFADENNDEWYHVITASGIEGYCMKKYITVKP